MDIPLLQWSTARCELLVRLRWLAIATALTSLIARPTLAQIVPDTSLGNTPSSVISDGDNSPSSSVRIEGGLVSGPNLFHSFQDFNVSTGDRVYFASPNGIETILTRVTGLQPSNILGTLGVLGEADLFLLNPNGIVFGPQAQLDIGGSFLATSAEAIQFGAQGSFSASDPQRPPLLGVSPSALFFSNSSPGEIVNRSVAPAGVDAFGDPALGLRVPNGENLLLVGGTILIDGGGLNAQGGDVQLVGISGPGQINIVAPDSTFEATALSLEIPQGMARSNVTLQNGALVDVTSGDRGSITLAGANVGVLGGSRLFAGIAPGLGTANSQSGDITLSASDTVTVEGPGFTIQNVLWDGATGHVGGLSVDARDFVAQNIAFARVATFGDGNAGGISLRVQNAAVFTGSSTFFNEVGSAGSAQVEGISIEASSLDLLDGAELISRVQGNAVGQAGGVQVRVSGAIVIDGVGADGFSSGVFVTTRPGAVGFSGDVQVSANSLDITRGARIQTGTSGQGNSGNVTVEVSNQFLLDGADAQDSVTGIFTDLDTGGVGRGGDILVDAGSLVVKNGAQFTANTFSRGDAGDIVVNVQGAATFDGVNNDGVTTGSASGLLVLARSGLFSAVGETLDENSTVPAFGDAGKITLNADSLTITNGAAFGTAVVSGSVGNAAPILIAVNGAVVVSGADEKAGASGIFTDVRAGSVGNASNIEISATSLRVAQGGLLNASIANDGVAGALLINARAVEIESGGQIAVATSGAGNAGDIFITGGDSLTLLGDRSGLFANSTASSTGNSGSIVLSTGVLTLRDGAQIAVNSQGTGEGGDIQINADSVVLANGARVSAETASNQGGDITLLSKDAVLLRNGSNISATAGTAEAGGDGGNITIGTDFLLAVPNQDSNITANAFLGRGGNVQIAATGIYGIEPRSQESHTNNDITASSSFGVAGVVDLDTPGVDPTSGIVALPSNIGVPQISQRCRASEGTSRFVATGRGGIPLGPEDAIAPQDLWSAPSLSSPSPASDVPAPTELPTAEAPLVEAQGWQVGPDGKVEITAEEAAHLALGDRASCSLRGALPRGAS